MARIPESTLTDNFRDGDPWDAQTLNKIVAVLIAGINANYEDILEAVMTPGPAGPVGPQGPVGDKGDKGDTVVSVAVGETETVLAGTPASVENVGTPTEAVFNFKIPQGERGLPGSFINATDKVYVSKQGSDSNDGLTVVATKLTLESAVTQATVLFNAGATRVNIIVIDNGEYTIAGTGTLTIPFYVDLDASENLINGSITMSPHSTVSIKEIKGIPTDNRVGVTVKETVVTDPSYLTDHGSLTVKKISDSNFSYYTFKGVEVIDLDSYFTINIDYIMSSKNISDSKGYGLVLTDGHYNSYLKVNIKKVSISDNLSDTGFTFMKIGGKYTVDLTCDYFENFGLIESYSTYFTEFTGEGATLYLGVKESSGIQRHSIHDANYDVANTTILKEGTRLTIERIVKPYGELSNTNTGDVIDANFLPFTLALTFEVNSSVISLVNIQFRNLNLNSLTTNTFYDQHTPLGLNLNETLFGHVFAKGKLWYANTSRNAFDIGTFEIEFNPALAKDGVVVDTTLLVTQNPVNMDSNGIRTQFTENRVVGGFFETARIPTIITY